MCTVGAGLMCRLKRALEKECAQWNQWTCLGLHKGTQLVTADERDDIQRWLCQLAKCLALAPDTVALSACILDRTLFTTRVQTKYLQCVALSALYIACKICEEPEAVPPVPELIREAGCICSVQELVRMERVLLKRISWDLSLVTPYTFLQLMLAIGVPQNSHLLLQEFRPLIELVSSNHVITSRYRPSTLALAMFSIVLEWHNYPNWLAMTLYLEELIGITAENLITCREHLMDVWRKRVALESPEMVVEEENMDIENECREESEYYLNQQRKRESFNTTDECRRLLDNSNSNNGIALLMAKENTIGVVIAANNREDDDSPWCCGQRKRKRQRRKSRSETQTQNTFASAELRLSYGNNNKNVTAVDHQQQQGCIDELYDAMQILYGVSG